RGQDSRRGGGQRRDVHHDAIGRGSRRGSLQGAPQVRAYRDAGAGLVPGGLSPAGWILSRTTLCPANPFVLDFDAPPGTGSGYCSPEQFCDEMGLVGTGKPCHEQAWRQPAPCLPTRSPVVASNRPQPIRYRTRLSRPPCSTSTDPSPSISVTGLLLIRS